MDTCLLPAGSALIAINPQYYQGRKTPCPDCGGMQWIVGRVVAECAYCDTPLPLAASQHRTWLGGFS
ncbi:YgzB family protein [Sphingomonas bisphenolicum]|uniref:YgzB family protein n=1 Tax=Sphingomonas bisphenolicum TaxID=296544 RepID=UPI0021C420CC|nr:YgzB family protein [Sphingomonas bisphenolicum]